MRCLLFVCTLVGALTGVPAVTLAGDTELDRQCYGTGTAPQTIEACTVVIAGGLVGRKDLGAAFKLRGSAYADVGEYDKAIDAVRTAESYAPEEVRSRLSGSVGADEDADIGGHIAKPEA